MPATFHVHAYSTQIGPPWGWLSRDRDPNASKIALWYDVLPAPGNHPDARIEWYVGPPLFLSWKPYIGWRIVDACGHSIVDRIDSEPTAREILAWLCPADSLPPTARGEGGFGSTGTGTGPAPGSDDDRAYLKARVQTLEAEVSEARAEAAKRAAEVERLRAEVERRRDVYDLMGAVEHSANKLAAHENRGAWEERAAIVAYLRQSASVADEFGAVAYAIAEEADAIEAGNHRAGSAK